MGDAVPGDHTAQVRAGQQSAGRCHDERGPGGQRHGHLPEERVEAGRGELQDVAGAHDTQGPGLVLGKVGEARVGDHDALGTPGGSRCVDHIRGTLPVEDRPRAAVRALRWPVVAHRRACLRPVQFDPDESVRGADARRRAARRQQQGRSGVVQHLRDALRGILRVHRQIGGARLHDREHGYDQLHGPGQRRGDDRAGADAAREQMGGQPVRPGVELRVRDPLLLEEHRCGVRGGPGLLLEPFEERADRRRVGGGVPLVQEALPLAFGEQVVGPDGPVRVGDGRFQHLYESCRDPFRRTGGEQVGRVFEESAQAAR